MATPIAQSTVDEERDRLIAEKADETVASITNSFDNFSSLALNLGNESDFSNFNNLNGQSSLCFNKNEFFNNNQLNNASGLTSLKSGIYYF